MASITKDPGFLVRDGTVIELTSVAAFPGISVKDVTVMRICQQNHSDLLPVSQLR